MNKWVGSAATVVAIVALAGVWQCGRSAGHRAATQVATAKYVETVADLTLQVTTSKNRESELLDAIRSFEDEVAPATVVAATRAPVSHVGQVRTVLQPVVQEVLVEVPVHVPATTVPCLLGPLTIGSATFDGRSLSCATLALHHRVTFATGKKRSSALVQVSSAYDPETWVDQESELEVVHTPPDPHKVISPIAVLGITGSVRVPAPVPDLTASLSLQWLHPTPEVDVLGVRLSGNSRSARLGLDVVGFTPGWKPFKNTGLYVGASFGVPDLTASVDVTLGVRL